MILLILLMILFPGLYLGFQNKKESNGKGKGGQKLCNPPTSWETLPWHTLPLLRGLETVDIISEDN